LRRRGIRKIFIIKPSPDAAGLIFMKWLLCLLCAVRGVAAAADIAVTDDRGVTLRLAAPALRIVALAPSITEMVFAAGAGAQLAAVPRFSDFPPQAAALPQIGDASSLDAERILALQPDLVIGWKSGNRSADLARLERLGLKLFVIEPVVLDDVPRALRAIGALAGTGAAAETTARAFEKQVTTLRARYAGAAKVRVFYEIWHQPLMTVNDRHMIGDVVRLCGGENIFAALPVLTPVVSLEDVMARKPQVVLGGGSSMSGDELATLWRAQARLTALRDLPVLRVDPDAIQRQTPRVLLGAEEVCRHLDSVRGQH
jgi:iron complex transport system substrate-binding protein